MTQTPSIEDVKALQRKRNLLDVHVVWLGSDQFTIAHTNAERTAPEPLEYCDLHRWLERECDGPPAKPGFYVVTPHEPDADSEPYPVRRWAFTPMRYPL